MKDHPLIETVLTYYREFSENKEQHEDISNLEYNEHYGLSINAPDSWPWLDAISRCIEEASKIGNGKFMIVYPSTALYRSVADEVPLHLTYMSWHEIYVAMKRVDEDIRHLQRIRRMISASELTFVIGASQTAQEVIDQVKGYCEGCLVILG